MFHSNRLPIYLNSVHHEFWSNSINLIIFYCVFFSALIILKSRQQSRFRPIHKKFFFSSSIAWIRRLHSLQLNNFVFSLDFIRLLNELVQKPAAVEEPMNYRSSSLFVERGHIWNFFYSVFQSISTSVAFMLLIL